ncbi:bifunctional acetate--CoA ligase family protein/GNAT family N-acetyltransferase [Zhihengliuella flava]|uniref:Acyl-CoA synthetase (NDP forming)/RimJ/RimL family protein N-acetyltransferase n=1 Tax=Zhihengliuella flava TaxID=1285193 RepID=A0A931DC19_9MICC|nr:GNAT family N-acetyltransferase [Zhihengliuella flava]MBG6085677.1 acyl-CoA synthetase (NDP forming)/RimJ/RimL family protein N-acetyltransferase [Zhihengliuella flava]
MADRGKTGEYPAHWEADVVLRDGTTAHLRPIAPTDADALQRMHSAQSQTSIYLRFFTYKSHLTRKELERFTQVDHRNRVAFVVVRREQIIGVGRYDRLDHPTEAEVAFNVADNTQGQGVGSILLEHLAAAARENGIERFSAEVLPENRKMLAVFAEAGYEVARKFDDGVVALEFPLDPTDASRAVMEAREHRAEALSLGGLLAPQSVAVVGASREWGSVGYSLLENIIESGFTGAVYGINRDAFELAGMVSYNRLTDVPDRVDLAVIAVPREELDSVIVDCAQSGVKGVVVVTDGFEGGGDDAAALQRHLVKLARGNGMRLVGPASLGLVNTAAEVRLNASVAPAMPKAGSLGLFSQSAAMGIILYTTATRRGVGVSSIVSAGHRADVSGNDAMQFWEDDESTSAVGLYLESFGNPRKFSRIARRLARRKPVIVAKSDYMGVRLPPGHSVRTTQAPLGAVDEMLRQSGVIRVATNEQLLDVAQIVASQPLPAGPRVGILSNSSALADVVADTATQHGMTPAHVVGQLDLEDGQSRALPRLQRALAEVMGDDDVDSALVVLLPVRGIALSTLARAIYDAARHAQKPVVVAFAGQLDSAFPAEGVLEEGEGAAAADSSAGTLAGLQPAVPYFASPGQAAEALGRIVHYVAWRERDFGQPLELQDVDTARAERLIDGHLSRVNDTELVRLSAAEAAELLGCYGLEVLESVPFTTEEEALATAERIGYPLALKTTDQHLRHRLDLGGVRLNIYDADSLRGNIAHMREILAPFGAVGLELQAMAPSGQGCVVRALEDPLLGPLVSYGLAGDAVNLLDDWAHAIPPLSSTDLDEFVRTPSASRKLFGYQGVPALDVEALKDVLHRVATLKDQHPEIALVEFNPLLVSEAGTTILSADVHIGNAAERTDSARRSMPNF